MSGTILQDQVFTMNWQQKREEISRKQRSIHKDPRILLPDASMKISEDQLFGHLRGQHILELGSGFGEFCEGWLRIHPDDLYVAMEVKGDRIKKMLRKLDRIGNAHIRVVSVNFNWFLEELFPLHCFDVIVVNFPDPWPKRRHWKHRLVQKDFPERMATLLRPGGWIHLATDYGPYARRIISHFRKCNQFVSNFNGTDFTRERPDGILSTKFESIAIQDGKLPYYMQYRWMGT